MIHLRGASTRVRKILFPWRLQKSFTDSEVASLANFVLDYARMRSQEAVNGFVLIEVDELAFRFREDRDLIKRALDHLVENDRRVQQTEFDGLWRIAVSLSEPLA